MNVGLCMPSDDSCKSVDELFYPWKHSLSDVLGLRMKNKNSSNTLITRSSKRVRNLNMVETYRFLISPEPG